MLNWWNPASHEQKGEASRASVAMAMGGRTARRDKRLKALAKR